jgi:hypothetical protein
VDICFILGQLGIFCAHLLHYRHFGILYQEKSGNPVGNVSAWEQMGRVIQSCRGMYLKGGKYFIYIRD